LRDAETLLPVLSVPLLATLTVLLFKTLRRLPENKLRLYQMFIDLLLGGWNLAKGLKRPSIFSSTVKTVVLTRLAGLMHARKVKECTGLEIISTLRQVASALVPDVQNVVAEFVEDGLLLPTGRSTYTFPHLSFQEYLAARDALDPSRQEERKIVQSFLSGDDWYKEVATFLVSMTTNPVGMRGWIVDLAKPFATPHALSDSEKRAGYLLAKLTETFPDCKIKVQV
jgi:predicted NACHT family NTPase